MARLGCPGSRRRGSKSEQYPAIERSAPGAPPNASKGLEAASYQYLTAPQQDREPKCSDENQREVSDDMDIDMDRKACLRAAELVEQGHCKHAAARNSLGISVLPTDEAAESWCATGALEKAYAELYGEPMERLALWNTIRERIMPAACQARDALPWKRLKRTSSLPKWNNLPSTRPEQVATFLRKIAEVVSASRKRPRGLPPWRSRSSC
jgi:hypothetical protein